MKDPNWVFEIDSFLIEQVINLILNVIEMVSNPQIVVSATISHKGTTQIRVTDNDGGIPAEIVDRIFIPFFSTKKPELVLV